MRLPIYQVDSFTDSVFKGNPAAVCPLREWLSDGLMQKIAMENNLSETAFFVPRDSVFQLRWFTPTIEVDLCGHATLAAGHVIFSYLRRQLEEVVFETRSGTLRVNKEQDFLTLDLPADSAKKVDLASELADCFNIMPIEVFKGRSDYMLVYDDEQQILDLKPDSKEIAALDARGVIVTARGKDADFVSRFFAPQSGVDEDPVTGSAHATLTPYWSRVLGKRELVAAQLSSRGGRLRCRDSGSRVEISGKARTYLTGEIELDL